MGLQTSIRDAANWNVPVVGMQSSMREVIEKMVAAKVSAVLVKSDDTVTGLVSEMDVLDCIVGKNDLDTARVAEFLTKCEVITGQPVKSPCAQLDESESVENALKVLAAAGTRHLLVAGEGDKAGIAALHDLLRLAVA
ncbi:MAG: CBS domain-containing protein [Desulfobulbaceae bacterium]|jgi:predicted transcriptional regulator|nr:CBS domain-containing protein [Desulfobulbaceae bacterium]MDY0352198.1 CBS domain-containing protein [Desulfobulbaceae bacterium]